MADQDAEPEVSEPVVLARIDFTYWPLTGEVEWHGHTDAEGDTELLPASMADVVAGLAAFASRLTGWRSAAEFFESRRRGCDATGRHQIRSARRRG